MHITREMDILKITQIRVINQYTFLVFLFLIFMSVNALVFANTAVFFTLLLISGGLLFLFFFSTFHFKTHIQFIVYIVLALLFFYYSGTIDFRSGIIFYYFPLLSSVLIVFNGKHKVSFGIGIYVIVFVLFSVGHLLDFNFFESQYSDAVFIKSTRTISFIQSFILMCFNGFFVLNNYNILTRLYHKNVKRKLIVSNLKRQLNETTQDNIKLVMEMAMNNDVAFIPYFKQVFPDFYNKLIALNPNMSNEEFKLCAMLRLGFTTKDIAEYTYLSVRTVQGRKNRLRKSFDIPSETDLYYWIELI